MTLNLRSVGRTLVLTACGLYAAASWANPGWTNRQEYDLVLKIRVESSPQKQLDLLNQWKKQFPKSDMAQVRRELFLGAYEALSDNAGIFDTAREMIADQPSSFVGNYWCALLTPEMKDMKPEILETGDKAAQQLLSKLDAYFAAAQKPERVADADWQKQKANTELLALRTIGWVQWQRANYPSAEKTFTTYLEKNPKSGEVTSWLGYVLAKEGKPIAAAWQFSRAASFKGEGALPEIWRRQVEELVDRMYAAYHGDLEGVDKLKTGAAAAAAPPADFQVESAQVIKARKAEEELMRSDPELGAWLKMYKQLTSADGEKYFLETVKPNPLPKLRGTVVRCDPPAKPSEIVLGLNSASAEEVILKVSVPYTYPAEAGTVLEFEGTPDTFVKEPFKLTINSDPEKISGWPEKPIPAPKPPIKKK